LKIEISNGPFLNKSVLYLTSSINNTDSTQQDTWWCITSWGKYY